MRKGKKLSIEEYKKVLLTVLKKIDFLCEENGLHYQLAYGTLLGAVRHKGFIPWDDDVDIFMPRKDYIKLQEIILQGDYGINFLSIDTEPQTIYPYGKICDQNTDLYEKNFRHVPGYGAFVDVFPLDYVPESGKKRGKIFKKYNFLIKVIQHSSQTNYSHSESSFRNLARMAAFWGTRWINTEKLIRYVDRHLQLLCDENQTNLVGVPWGEAVYTKEDVYKTHKTLFEGIPLNITDNYDMMLTKMYGDYMQMPPVEKRVNPHNLECYLK